MAEKTKKTAVKKTEPEVKDEIVTEEVEVTKKVTKDVKEKAEEPKERMVVEEVSEEKTELNEEKNYDHTPEEVENTEGKTDVAESESEKITSDEETDNNEDLSDTKQATVYADDFDAVKVEKRFSMSRLLLFILIIIISAGIFFTGLMLYQSNNKNFSVPNISFLSQPTPTPTEIPTPTPSPTPEFVNSDFRVQVLNGSGVSGQAGAVAGLLEEEGFEDVVVGNASTQDFEDTEVQMKEDVPSEVFDEIAKILSDYTVVEGDELDEGDDFDIIITVGQENSDTTPTPTENEEV